MRKITFVREQKPQAFVGAINFQASSLRELEIGCGCFGVNSSAEHSLFGSLARNFALLLGSARVLRRTEANDAVKPNEDVRSGGGSDGDGGSDGGVSCGGADCGGEGCGEHVGAGGCVGGCASGVGGGGAKGVAGGATGVGGGFAGVGGRAADSGEGHGKARRDGKNFDC